MALVMTFEKSSNLKILLTYVNRILRRQKNLKVVNIILYL
jgi:hypothetical protein